MLGLQGFDREPTEERLKRILKEKPNAAEALLGFLEDIFFLLELNRGLDLGKIGRTALLEMALDRMEGKERPIHREELDQLFPERRGQWQDESH